MLFNSFHFFIYFPLVVLVYFLLNYQYRKLFLLVASCYFYMVFIPYYILILFGLIVFDFFAGIAIERTSAIKKRKILLALSIIANVGILGTFKYYNFFIDNVTIFCNYFDFNVPPVYYLNILLPVGLSFHTFQSMSYTIEVYRGNQPAERNIITYALYVMFFPQLVAGPIERPQHLLPQLKANFDVDYSRIVYGLKQMLWGFFKKIVIADRLAVLVKQGYGDIDYHDGPSLLIYTYFFAIQIYCDFSGYTDIAIGAAKVLGINLGENFRNPYFSKSIKEFWRRWHISLASWFRDYVYIPLGGKVVGRWRWFYNVMIVFLLSGFWHGANWTFIVWGALHGSYLIIGHFLKKTFMPMSYPIENKRSLKAIILNIAKVIITFNLVAFAWVFFRANNLLDAYDIITKITFFSDFDPKLPLSILRVNDFSSLMVTTVIVSFFIFFDYLMNQIITQQRFLPNRKIGYALFATIFVLILIFGHFTDTNFIYFQF